MHALEIEDRMRSYFAASTEVGSRLKLYLRPNPNEKLPRPFKSWLSVTAVPSYSQLDLFEALFHLNHIELGRITLGIRDRDGLNGKEGFGPVYEGLRSADITNFDHPEVKGHQIYYYQHIIFLEGAVHLGLLLNDSHNSNSLYLKRVLNYLHTSVAFIAGLFDHAGYRGPLEMQADLLGIKHLQPTAEKSNIFLYGLEKLTINDFHHRISTSVIELVEDSIPVIQPVMDHLCRAGGKPKCEFYRYDTPGVFDENWVKVQDGWYLKW